MTEGALFKRRHINRHIKSKPRMMTPAFRKGATEDVHWATRNLIAVDQLAAEHSASEPSARLPNLEPRPFPMEKVNPSALRLPAGLEQLDLTHPQP